MMQLCRNMVGDNPPPHPRCNINVQIRLDDDVDHKYMTRNKYNNVTNSFFLSPA